MTVDVLAIGAHPDDIELGIGGLIHKLSRHGCRVGVLDLTRGEMGSRGTPEERIAEAEKAARILGVVRRENAGLPDSELANTPEQQRLIIPFIRSFRPRVLMLPMAGDRHPDHRAAHDLVRAAAYFSGLARIATAEEPHRPDWEYFYHPYTDNRAAPSVVVDISDDFEAKLEALRAYASQFFNPDYPGNPTYIASEAFWEGIRIRAAYWGRRIRANFGEPLYTDDPVGLAFPPGLEPTVIASAAKESPQASGETPA